MSEIEGGNVRGRPPVKWRDRVQEYVIERGEGSLRNSEQARRECQDRERWKLFCHGHALVGAPRSKRQNELNCYLCLYFLRSWDLHCQKERANFCLMVTSTSLINDKTI